VSGYQVFIAAPCRNSTTVARAFTELEEALKLAKGMDSDYLPGWCGPVTDD
jgi:hypothetical protein